jgi:hypothetical protein
MKGIVLTIGLNLSVLAIAGEKLAFSTPPNSVKEAKPTVAAPAVSLAWPRGAGFGQDHLYVNDTYCRRVVRLDKAFAAEALCPAP